MNELFAKGRTILRQLAAHGYKGYFVGGCVRDYHMGRVINDVDITTDALPEDIERIFIHTIDIGKVHGTIIVLVEDIPFEVTTFRTESDYSDFRRPDVVTFTRDLDSDLERRDFTMNAMAMDGDFDIIDPYDGMMAINRKVITTVGESTERFGEDALRILRAARFSSQLEFKVDDDTKRAMLKHAENLKYVAVERSVAELVKLYRGANPSAAKVLMAETHLIKYLPFLDQVDEAAFLKSNVHSLECELALQIYQTPKLKETLHELKLSNAVKTEILSIVNLLKMVDSSSIRHLAYDFDDRVLNITKDTIVKNSFLQIGNRMTRLESAIAMKPKLPISDPSEINLDGRTLMRLFEAQGGRWIRTILSAVEREILAGQLDNDRDKIIEWVKAHVEFEAGNIKIAEK